MPMVDGDWSIDRATGNIRYIGYDHPGSSTITAGSFVVGEYYQIRNAGSTDFTLVGAADSNVGTRFEATGVGSGTGDATQIASYATVIQFHRWLQAFADDAEFSGDDELDIVDQNPSDRSTDNIITLVNGFNIDDTAAEHLYDGSVIQDSGDTIYDGIVNFGNSDVHIQIHQDGAVLTDDYWNYGWQSGTHTGSADAAVLTDSTQSWTTNEWAGYTLVNVTDGSRGKIESNTATTITLVDGLYGGTEDDFDASDVYRIAVPINGDSTAGISHRFMIKVRADGVDIDRRKLLGTSRRYYNTYSEFNISATARGNNVLALSDADDLNNATAYATIDAIADIVITETTGTGPELQDISGDGTDEEYAWVFDRGAQTINTVYEYYKHIQTDASAETLNGINGELHRGITHDFGFDGQSGTTFVVNDTLVWGAALVCDGGAGTFTVGEAIHEDTATPAWKGRVLGGDLTVGAGGTLIVDLESGTLTDNDTFTGQGSGATAAVMDASPPTTPTATAGAMLMFSWDDNGTDGEIYGQLVKGVAPVEDQTVYEENASADLVVVDENAGSTPVTARTVTTPMIGQSTGSALIATYGIGQTAADAGASDLYLPLNTTVPFNPPNNVTFTVDGLVAGDRILVTNNSAGNIDFTQMATDTNLTGPTETSVSINPTPGIPDNTPATGTIRIERDDGLYSRHPYSDADESTDTFTITSHDFSTNNATQPANVFISYIDTAAADADEIFNTVFDSSQTLFIRVRDGGATPIKNLETTGNLGSTGGTVTVNRIDDT